MQKKIGKKRKKKRKKVSIEKKTTRKRVFLVTIFWLFRKKCIYLHPE